MKRQWQIRRTTVQPPDARQRWDRAYQIIMRWSFENEQARGPSANDKEKYHEGGGIRAGLDLSAGQAPDN
jgi:hypothetical protein